MAHSLAVKDAKESLDAGRIAVEDHNNDGERKDVRQVGESALEEGQLGVDAWRLLAASPARRREMTTSN